MYIPVITGSKSGRQKPPGWAGLAADEQFIRSWGKVCCGSGNRNSTIAGSVVAALGTVIAGQVGAFDFDMFNDDGSSSPVRIALISFFCLAMLATVGLAIWAITRRSGLQAVLTDRHILFREKGQRMEIPLRDLRDVSNVRNGNEQLVRFTVRGKRGPVASLPVEEPQEVIEQIEQLAREAGAEID